MATVPMHRTGSSAATVALGLQYLPPTPFGFSPLLELHTADRAAAMAAARQDLTDTAERLRFAVSSFQSVGEIAAALTAGMGAWSLSKAAAKASKAARMAKVEAAKVVKAAEAAEVAATKATAAVTAAEEAKAAAAAQAKKTAKVAAKAAAAAAAAAQAAEVADAAAAALEVGKMYAALSAFSFFRNLYCTQGRFMRKCV